MEEGQSPSVFAKFESLGPLEKRVFLTLKKYLQVETGATCSGVPGEENVDGGAPPVPAYSTREFLRYGQTLLAVYRQVRRGIVPDPRLVQLLQERLPQELQDRLKQELEINRDVKPGLSRAQLAKEVLKDNSLKRLAVLPPDAAAQVNHAVRLEALRDLQETLARKFLKSSLRTPEQIYRYITQQEGVCSLSSLTSNTHSAGGDHSNEVIVKLKVLMASSTRPKWPRRAGGKRSNPLFCTLSKLRHHRITPARLHLSKTARLRDELVSKYRTMSEFKKTRRETCRDLARQAAGRVANMEIRKQAAAEREQKERMKALRERDMESYMKLIKQTKNKRIHDILQNTEKLLQDIGAKIELERNAQERAYQEAEAKAKAKEAAKKKEAVPVEGSEVATEEQQGEAVKPEEEEAAEKEEEEPPAKSKPLYYTLSHRLREQVLQPESMTGGKLMTYQLGGLEFLVSLYNNNISGILADEMGLGKTIQTIALVAYLKEKKNNPGPHLVTVPLSTLPNWAAEFNKWAPSLRVLQYRGNKNDRRLLNSEIRRGKYNVLLTTFEYILRERKVLSAPRWKFIIVDEGHKMKNVKSKFHITLGDFRSTHRLLLTGTPLQNNLNELWALLNFLMPQTFSSSEDFERWFEEPFKDQFSEAQREEVALTEEEKLVVINRLHLVLRPFLLRRVKADVLSDLPSKREYVIRVQLSRWQSMVYEQLVNKCLKVRDSSGKITSKSVANVIMQLRKAVNHPYLFLDEYRLDDNLWRVSGKFELLDRMLPKLLRYKHKILIFCQMTAVMDIMGDYFDLRNFKYHRLDGSMMIGDRQERMDDFNDPKTDTHIFVLSTRAGGLGLNLQAADTVILFDSDWNPHADLQAQARAHRVGQKREVRVFRFVTVSPVEELILARAQHKLSIDEQIIQAGMFSNKFNEKEREEKLRGLLSQKDAQGEVRVTTPQELIRYMSRSEEEEEQFSLMDMEIFGADIYNQLFEHDDALDESEGLASHTAESSTDLTASGVSEVAEEEEEEDNSSEKALSTATKPELAPTPSAADHNRVEELLIKSKRLVGDDEIPPDIVLIKNIPKDEESYFTVSTDLGVRRSRLRTSAPADEEGAAAEAESESDEEEAVNNNDEDGEDAEEEGAEDDEPEENQQTTPARGARRRTDSSPAKQRQGKRKAFTPSSEQAASVPKKRQRVKAETAVRAAPKNTPNTTTSRPRRTGGKGKNS